MPVTMYCWRCRSDVPMLTDDEFGLVNPTDYLEQVKKFREQTGCSLAEAKANPLLAASTQMRYEQITGMRTANIDLIWHHRVSLYGAPCSVCKKPLRTPAAQSCAACGAPKA